MLIRKRTEVGHPMHPYRTIAAGVELAFGIVHHDGDPVLGCVIAPEHPQHDALAKLYANVPGYDVIPDHRPVASRGPDFFTAAGSLLPVVPSLLAAMPRIEGEVRSILPSAEVAITNGWLAVDLAGTGAGGDPGPAGGCSPVTGLYLAQMALTAAPAGWDAKRTTHYPWEIEGWRPPGLDWVPPAVPSKRPVEAVPAPTPTEPTSEGATAFAGDTSTSEDDEAAPSAYEAAIAAGMASKLDGPAEGDGDAAVAAGYPADQVDEARRMAHALSAALGGKKLHHNKFNWAVKKRNGDHPDATPLTTATEAQLDGLLRHTPT